MSGTLDAKAIFGAPDISVKDPEPSDQWFPYPSKTVRLIYAPYTAIFYLRCYGTNQTFILDTIDSLPRLRISDSLMKIILWAMKESGASNVPSFSALRKSQEKLRSDSSIKTHRFESPLGNLFWMNDPVAIVAKVPIALCNTGTHG